MKKLIFFLFALSICSLAYSQSVKVVVDRDGTIVGELVKVNKNTYTVENQDIFEVQKSGTKIITVSASAGQGTLECKNPGIVNVRSKPSTSSSIIGKMISEDGDLPETYQCLGKVKGWYKVRINGKTGYVREDLVFWNWVY